MAQELRDKATKGEINESKLNKIEDEINKDIESKKKSLTKTDIIAHIDTLKIGDGTKAKKGNRPNKKGRAKARDKKFREEDGKIFGIIKEFVEELEEQFTDTEITNFAKVIKETKAKNKAAILRINENFAKFCTENVDAIKKLSISKITGTISFSSVSFIDIKKILTMSNADTQKTIWQWLATIHNELSSDESAKEIVSHLFDEDGEKKSPSMSNESEIITDLMKDMVNTVKPSGDDNIENVIKNILGSGLISKVCNKVSESEQNGTLNPQKLIGTIQATISNLQNRL